MSAHTLSPVGGAFLEDIVARPDDDAPRLIYADWLEERGDPRGEFIRLQCALAGMTVGDPRRPALQERERQLLARHAHDWCAPLGLEPGQCTFRRGFVEVVEMHAEQFVASAETLFRAAPVRQIHFLHATASIAELAACPWLTRLRTLDLSGNALRDSGAAVLAASPHLSGLAALDLGGCEIHQKGAEHLANAVGLSRLGTLGLAGCGIGAAGLRAILYSPALRRLTALDVRGNHQCWVTPNRGEPWVTLTETNVKNDGVRLLAESPESARLEEVDLSLNQVEDSGWDILLNSPHLSGVRRLNVFETDHVYAEESPEEPGTAGLPYTVNEEIADVLCVSIPGGRRRPLGRHPGDPRFTAPPCTLDEEVVRRLRQSFGPRVTFDPPSVRFGAHFRGTREDWYGRRAFLELRPTRGGNRDAR